MLRFLILVISLLSGAIYWIWASQPLWVSPAFLYASYIGFSEPDQTVVALVLEESGAYFEWRELLTGNVVKRVPLQLEGPPKAVHAYFNSQLGKREHDLVVAYVIDHKGKSYTLTFMLNTGKSVGPVDESTGDIFDVESRGRRCALFNPSTLFLVDGEQTGFRQLKIPKINNARVLADGKHVVCTLPDVALMLDWNTGKTIHRVNLQPSTSTRYWIFVSNSSDIFLFHYGVQSPNNLYAQRWIWNGKELRPATMLVPIPQSEVGFGTSLLDSVVTEDRNGRIRLACYASETWPAIVRPALDWLSKQGFKVDKYYPRHTRLLSVVLERDCSIAGKYEHEARDWEFLLDQYQLRIRLTGTQTVISLHNTNPVWPNAIAVAMLVYLLGYVYRYRQVRVT